MTNPPGKERRCGKRRTKRAPSLGRALKQARAAGEKVRGLNRFNESEVARAGRAAKAIGAERVEIDPATGKIFIIMAKSGESVASNDLDQWLKDRNARQA
jgi:hypothetical protein